MPAGALSLSPPLRRALSRLSRNHRQLIKPSQPSLYPIWVLGLLLMVKWSSEEEAALKAGIDEYGLGKWSNILKDPKFGPILHLRSNVDIKDKWRNISLMENGFRARYWVRGGGRSTKKIVKRGFTQKNKLKRGDMILSTVVLNDPEVVKAEPLAVLSGTSEVSELACIEKPMSRLDNPIVDAITKAKEPHQSSRTTIASYLKKKAGEYPDPHQDLFEKGKRIEVLTREKDFSDSWYVATVIKAKKTNFFNKYYVEYETLMDDDDTSSPLKEFVDPQLVRPLPPLTSLTSFRVDDIVDAFYYDGWWIGVVTKALADSRFKVTFEAPLAEHEFHASELRIHLDWVNGQWVDPQNKIKAAELQIFVGKEVEVSFEKEDYSVWYSATVLEDFADNSYLVEYFCKKGREASPFRTRVKLPHIRPQPPKQRSRSFILLDKVDAFNGFCWTSGLIIKKITDKRYMVSLKNTENKVFSGTNLRPHMEWIDGRWIDASKSTGTESDPSHLRPLKKFRTDNAANFRTLHACIADTMNLKSPINQYSTSDVCQTDAAVVNAHGKITKEKKVRELDTGTSKIVRRRGRRPKIHESSTSDNKNNAGVRTAEGIKKKNSETESFVEEKDCELENIAPIVVGLGSPPEESQTFIDDRNGQGNVPAELIIEESTANSLTKPRETCPDLLESNSRMEIITESSEKANGGKTAGDPYTESPKSTGDGNVSNACVRTIGEKEKNYCKTKEIATILGLTLDGTRSPQDCNPCHSPPETCQTFISDQNGEENIPATLIIEESAKNILSKQMDTSPEILESNNEMEIPTESSEKDKSVVPSDKLEKCYTRKRGKGSSEPSAESPHSFVDDGSCKEIEVHTVAVNSTPILPFEKIIPLWGSIESMEAFQLFPQKPHFHSLENIDEIYREGLALGQMVTFSKIVKMIFDIGADMPRSSMKKCLENLIVLEDNGFDVRKLCDHLKDLEQESRIVEFKKKKRKIDEDVDEIDKKLKELQANRVAAMSKMEIKDAAVEFSRSFLNNINDRIRSMQFDFQEMAAAPW